MKATENIYIPPQYHYAGCFFHKVSLCNVMYFTYCYSH